MFSGASGASLQFDPQNDGLMVPEGFQVVVVAEGIGRARHLAVRDNGDIYVAMRQAHAGKCLAALRDEDNDGIADIIHYFGDFGECGSVEIHGDYLYFSNLKTVYRVALDKTALVPDAPVDVIAKGFSIEGPWHNYKVLAFDESQNIYVNVGAPSNACQEKWRTPGSPGMRPCPHLEQHAGVWRFRADQMEQTQSENGERYATGVRNGVALAWNPFSKALYAIPHGRDLLHDLWPKHYTDADSAALPAEEFFKLRKNFNGGWPYTYYDQRKGQRMVAPEYGGDGKTVDKSGQYENPIAAFPGHWGPNDLIFYTGKQFPKTYQGGAFVAFVGGWNRAPYPQEGYQVAFVPFDKQGLPTGAAVTFVDNFAGKPQIASPDEAQYRPTGLAEGPDGSLFIADSVGGRIWRVVYTGEKSVGNKAAYETAAPDDTALANHQEDAAAYLKHCASCHMASGSGVPSFQPSLKTSALVKGDAGALVKLVLEGRSGGQYANIMPAFAHLDNDTIAAILTYIRSRFGGGASPIDSNLVEQYR